jgi:hypothetical protein
MNISHGCPFGANKRFARTFVPLSPIRVRSEEMERGPICLTLFRFGKWQGSGNSKNATALRSFNNANEDIMFLTGALSGNLIQ